MLCNVCAGAGRLLSSLKGVIEWWTCPCCGGCGARVQYGPAEIGPGTRKGKN